MVNDTETGAVQVEVRLEPRDYVRFNLWHLFHSRGTRIRLVGAALFTLVLCVACYMLPEDARFAAQLLLFIYVPIYVLLWMRHLLLLPYRVKKSYARHKLLREPHRYTVSQHGIVVESGSGSSQHQWDVCWKACETGNAFYLYVTDNLAHAIPKRFFDSDAELERLREIVRASLDRKACRI